MLTKAEYALYRYEPTDEDITHALSQIAEHEAAIAALDYHVSKLLLHVRKAQEEKNKHKAAISRYKGVLTLARRIPGELLARIFEHCVADGWTRAPVIVSQVCSAWREAARAPSVWSHIYVDCDRGDPVARSTFWLHMAQRSLLRITIRTSQYHSAVTTTLDLLLNHISRWRSFRLEAPSISPATFVLSRCVDLAPELRELSVVIAEDNVFPGGVWNADTLEGDGQIMGLSEAFRQAPKLGTIQLTSNILQYAANIPPQITRLSVQLNPGSRPFFASEFLTMLNGCPLLLEFSLTIPRMDTREFVPLDTSQTVVLAHLTLLTLDVPMSFMTLPGHMHAPRLHSLHLRCPDDPAGYADDGSRAALRTFIEHSSPPISLLELYDIDVSQDDFLFCFAALSRLEELRLHGSEILDATVHVLCGPNGLCPRLSRLDLRWCGHLTGSALVDLARSRAASSLSSISEIAVINCSFVNEAHIIEVAEVTVCRLCIRGLDDYCKFRGCCDNSRYRQRFRLRHSLDLTTEQLARIKLW